MKITVERKALNAELDALAGVPSSKTTIPILANVLLSTWRNRLRISSTDLDLWWQSHHPCDDPGGSRCNGGPVLPTSEAREGIEVGESRDLG